MTARFTRPLVTAIKRDFATGEAEVIEIMGSDLTVDLSGSDDEIVVYEGNEIRRFSRDYVEGLQLLR